MHSPELRSGYPLNSHDFVVVETHCRASQQQQNHNYIAAIPHAGIEVKLLIFSNYSEKTANSFCHPYKMTKGMKA
jgi:hypothetical protein